MSDKDPKTSDPNRIEDDGFGVSVSPRPPHPNHLRACVPFLPPIVLGDFQKSGLEYGPVPKAFPSPLILAVGRNAAKVPPSAPTAPSRLATAALPFVSLSHRSQRKDQGRSRNATDAKRSSAAPPLASLWRRNSASPRLPVRGASTIGFLDHGGAVRDGGDSFTEPNSYRTSARLSCDPTVILIRVRDFLPPSFGLDTGIKLCM